MVEASAPQAPSRVWLLVILLVLGIALASPVVIAKRQGDRGPIDSGVLDPGAEGGRFAGHNRSLTLAQPGTYRFHCEMHPQVMRGRGEGGTVTGAAAGRPAAASAAPRQLDVGVRDFSLDPRDASVAPGGKVTVSNGGRVPHTLTWTTCRWTPGVPRRAGLSAFVFRRTA